MRYLILTATALTLLWSAPAQAYMPVTTDWDRPARLGEQLVIGVKQDVAKAADFAGRVGNAVTTTASHLASAADPAGPVQTTFQATVVAPAQRTIAVETQRAKTQVGLMVQQAPSAVTRVTQGIAAGVNAKFTDVKSHFGQGMANETYRMKGALHYLVNSVDGMLMRNGF